MMKGQQFVILAMASGLRVPRPFLMVQDGPLPNACMPLGYKK